MRTGIYILAKRLGATSLILTALAGCGRKEEIKVYSVEKPKEGGPMMAALNAQTPDVPVNKAPVSWKTPDGWKEVKPTGIRLGELHIAGENGQQAKVVIFSFPGSVGGELENWNRWRGEVKLPEATAEEMKSEQIRVGGEEAKLYDIRGEVLQSIIATLKRDGSSWFFKMQGDKEVVAKAKPAFIEFLKSVRFESDNNDSETAGIGKDADPHAGLNLKPNDPHAGLNINAKVPQATSGGGDKAEADDVPGQPKWSIPSGWKAKAAPPMVLKSFDVADGKATIAISKFPGDVGGTFANVNRWRGQLGLPPVTESELPKVISTVEVEGGKATFVDFTGKDKTGNPSRMIAAAVPNGEFTWFYKMTGDDATVGKEKEAFTTFVKTVRY